MLLFAAIAAGAVWWGHFAPERTAQSERGVRTVAVEAAELARGRVEETVRLTGSLEANATVTVQTGTAGRLEDVRFAVGDAVPANAVVARIASQEQQAAVRRAQAVVLVARAREDEAREDLGRMERRLERSQRLYDRNAISEAELDEGRAEVAIRRARVALAEAEVSERSAELAAEQARLDEFTVKAQGLENGGFRVSERYLDPGANVAANTPVLSLVATHPVRLALNAPERDHVRIEPGQPVEARFDAWPGRSFEGEVARVAPVIDRDSREGRVEVLIPNPEGVLRPGMFARVGVRVDVRENAIMAPMDSLVRRDGIEGLFLADGESGTARFVAVETGVETGDYVEIREATLDGPVITAGRHLIDDGTAISVRSIAESAPSSPGDTVLGEGLFQ